MDPLDKRRKIGGDDEPKKTKPTPKSQEEKTAKAAKRARDKDDSSEKIGATKFQKDDNSKKQVVEEKSIYDLPNDAKECEMNIRLGPSLFNPLSAQYHALNHFRGLNFGQKALTILGTVAATIISLPFLGLGGVAVFRAMTEKYYISRIKDTPKGLQDTSNKVKDLTEATFPRHGGEKVSTGPFQSKSTQVTQKDREILSTIEDGEQYTVKFAKVTPEDIIELSRHVRAIRSDSEIQNNRYQGKQPAGEAIIYLGDLKKKFTKLDHETLTASDLAKVLFYMVLNGELAAVKPTHGGSQFTIYDTANPPGVKDDLYNSGRLNQKR